MNTNEPNNYKPEDTTADKITQEGVNYFKGYLSDEYKEKTPAEQKFMVLYKARYLLSQIGTMEERRIARKQLKRMKNKGLGAL